MSILLESAGPRRVKWESAARDSDGAFACNVQGDIGVETHRNRGSPGILHGAVNRMKRLLAVAMATVLVAGVFAQGTFTIRRPSDGSRVRETVPVRIPKGSIGPNQYIGVLVNGKFLEAVVPDVSGDDYVYNLDTKGKLIPDGKMTIEVVLYQFTEGAPVVLNRSSVTVDLDNSNSITPDEDGRYLRYQFVPGIERVYNLTMNTTVSMVTQAQAQLGSRAAEIPLGVEKIRYLVATDNSYTVNGRKQGLIRFQPLPDKGKDYAMFILDGETEAKKYMDYEMHPVFMRVTDTGREVFSSWPVYFPMEGTAGETFSSHLVGLFPLPVLPENRVTVGKVWSSAIPMATIDLDKAHEEKTMVTYLPGRSTLEKFEWEKGIPCAKIRSELGLGARDLKGLKNLNQLAGEAQNLKIEVIQWFAIDRGILVKEEENFYIEQLVDVASQSGASGSLGGGGGPDGQNGQRRQQGQGGRVGGFEHRPGFLRNPFGSYGLTEAINFVQDSGSGALGPPPLPGQGGGGNQGGGFGRSGGGAGSVKMIFRQKMSSVTELER